MVKTKDQIQEEIDTDIEQFTTNFYNKYGVKAAVLYTLNIDKVPAMPMELVELVTNRCIREKLGNQTYTVRSKTRLREVINYRHTMFYYLQTMGYTLTSIGSYFGFNHATVIHSINKIKWFIEINDQEAVNTLIQLKHGFKETADGIVGDIQSTDPGEPNS